MKLNQNMPIKSLWMQIKDRILTLIYIENGTINVALLQNIKQKYSAN